MDKKLKKKLLMAKQFQFGRITELNIILDYLSNKYQSLLSIESPVDDELSERESVIGFITSYRQELIILESENGRGRRK